ncbi:hypothetical protein [Methanonatronarchaeum sp. AMET-Sl]|uniref:hypothetical protein n=1 Tax=Methanonatronarchaeum sp. AMET-Sl TaxID=3037654 RepID=UPI00244DC7B8|nr:hypothetical protein [Methanonatronarchaeum sp. AMET-Sl]WGI17031.1 hypothetical protein QEN48_05900 [Methanonatronarchaeum sp. AMET-Sl]
MTIKDISSSTIVSDGGDGMNEIFDSSGDNGDFSEDLIGRLEKKIAILKSRLERRKQEIEELEEENYVLKQEIESNSSVSEVRSNSSSGEGIIDCSTDSHRDGDGSNDAVKKDEEDCVVFQGPAGGDFEDSSVEESKAKPETGVIEESVDEEDGNGELENDDIIIID